MKIKLMFLTGLFLGLPIFGMEQEYILYRPILVNKLPVVIYAARNVSEDSIKNLFGIAKDIIKDRQEEFGSFHGGQIDHVRLFLDNEEGGQMVGYDDENHIAFSRLL